MAERLRTYRTELEQRRHAAQTLFSRVSQDYPASSQAQGAAIALSCQESGQNPLLLRRALIYDVKRLSQLTKAANGFHNPAEPKQRNENAPKHVFLIEVRNVIKTNFRIASRFMSKQPDELHRLLREYRPVS